MFECRLLLYVVYIKVYYYSDEQRRRGGHAAGAILGGAPEPQLHDDAGALVVGRRVRAALAARHAAPAPGRGTGTPHKL